jgi:hypothetical protein
MSTGHDIAHAFAVRDLTAALFDTVTTQRTAAFARFEKHVHTMLFESNRTRRSIVSAVLADVLEEAAS